MPDTKHHSINFHTYNGKESRLIATFLWMQIGEASEGKLGMHSIICKSKATSNLRD
jgi:hypothetical protein